MRVIRNNSTDPYFNLAAEEYLIGGGDDIFMLWRNERAVIIGRNQNAYAELNSEFIAARGIKAVRRMTGGGAVFHDLGNVNFTFITGGGEGGLDFSQFTQPVVKLLRSLGADAVESGRNDITVDGMKVSGNAQCRQDDRVMHHGTLLFSADISEMAGALRADPDKLSSKGIKSVRSRVANIRPLLREDMDVLEFMDRLAKRFGGVEKPLSDGEILEISALAASKYSTWEWNYGESREFSRRRRRYFPFGLVEIGISLERGVIAEAGITGDFFGTRPIAELEERLIGLRCEYGEVANALSDVKSYIAFSSAEEIAALIV